LPGAAGHNREALPRRTDLLREEAGLYAGFSNNHHNDGHVAVCIPAAPGEQEALIASSPATYYRQPYVGVNGWVGIELDQIGDDELGAHLSEAWKLIGSPRRK